MSEENKENKEVISTEDFTAFGRLMLEVKSKSLHSKLKKVFIQIMDESQKNVLDNAIQDGHTNREEIDMLMKKFDVKEEVISEIFKHKYDAGIIHEDGKNKKTLYMLTISKETGLYRMKDYVEKRFGTKVLLPHEAMEKFEDVDRFKNRASNYIG